MDSPDDLQPSSEPQEVELDNQILSPQDATEEKEVEHDPIEDEDDAHSLSGNQSMTSNPPDPFMEFSPEQVRTSIATAATANNGYTNSIIKKMRTFEMNPTKFGSDKKTEKTIEENKNGEDPNALSQFSFPLSFLSRDNSVEERRKIIPGLVGQSQLYDASQNMSPSDSIQIHPRPEQKKKSGFLTRGLNHLRNTINTNKSILKNKNSTKREIKRIVTYKSPEILKTPVDLPQDEEAFSAGAPETKGNFYVNEDKDDEGEQEQEQEEIDNEAIGAEIPIEKPQEKQFSVPVHIMKERMTMQSERSELVKKTSILTDPDENKPARASKTTSDFYVKSVVTSPSIPEELSVGLRGKNLVEPGTPLFTQGFYKKVLLLLLFIILSFVLLAILGSAITFPYPDYQVHSWLGHFFHGFLLAAIPILVMKEVIKASYEEAARRDKSEALITRRYGYIDLIFLFLVFGPISGVVMVMLMRRHFNPLDNPLELFASEMIVIAMNIAAIILYFAVRAWISKKRVKKSRKQGFFFVPIYRDFLTDLYSARATMQDQMETNIPTVVTVASHTSTDRKARVPHREEGIDKYQPKHSFQIISMRRVIGAQLLVVILYLQLLAVIGLTKLFHYISEEDKLGPGIALVLFFRTIMYVFTNILDLVNNKLKLNINLFVFYLHTAFSTMFYRLSMFHITEEKYIWVIVGSKALSKALVFGFYGFQVEIWKHALVDRMKTIFTRKTLAEKAEIRTIQRKVKARKVRARTDTISREQAEEVAKSKEEEKVQIDAFRRVFIAKFVLIGTNDLFYSFTSLGFILGYEALREDGLSSLFASQDLYVKGTWIDMLFDIGLFLVIMFIWQLRSKLRSLNAVEGLRIFWRKYAVNFFICSFGLLIGFIFLVHSFEVRNIY